MESRRFIFVMFGLTLLFCAAMVIYNFITMPPFGQNSTFSATASTVSAAVNTSSPAQTSPRLSTSSFSSKPAIILVNLNLSTNSELMTLPEIGPTLAQRIIDYRTANGNFKNINDILNVSGIGQKTLDKIKDLICV
jgi:comEA protein